MINVGDKGKIAKIVDKDSHNLITIDLDKGQHYWTVEMFEDKELTKYKMAFEILKNKLQLRVEDITNNGAPALLVLFYNGNMETISVDEYELLEELMKDEKC